MAVITGVIAVFCLLCCLPVSYSIECDAALGVADDSIIGDMQLSANMQEGSSPAAEGRLHGSKAWRPNNDEGEYSAVGAWIQVTFNTLENVTKIATQGRSPVEGGAGGHKDYVTEYKVQYRNDYDDGGSWMHIKKADNTDDMVFTGNMDRGTTVYQTLPNPVLLTSLRIEIVKCNDKGCALRFELYGCKECDAALGVADDSIIGDMQLSANMQEGNSPATEGRLHGSKAWRPNNDEGEYSAVGDWIQVTFNALVNVTKIATQGRSPEEGGGGGHNDYVTEYKVLYRKDGESWMYIENAENTAGMVFTGNTDRDGTVYQTLPNPVLLTSLRIEIVKCNDRGCALRFELYGCQVPICEVLNAPMNGHVTHTTATIFTIGDLQMIECDDGFTPMGETSTICTAEAGGDSATWEPDVLSTTCEEYTPASTTAKKYTPASTTTEKYTPASTIPEKYTHASTTAGEYTPASTTAGKYKPEPDRRTNPGSVAGSVIGVLLVIVIIIIVVIWLLKRNRETAKSTPQSGQAFDGPYELTIEGNNGPAKKQPAVVDQPDQEEYAYVDVNKTNTPQNEVKPDIGDIYQDVQDKPDEYAYAYADVNASKTADEPSDDGLVHIYAKSKHGGRPITKDKQNPAAGTGDIYQTIQEAPNENEYAYADVKVNANGEPANPQEGWEDNVIYAAGDDDEGIAADKGKEGWVDNNVYATTDNDAQNAEGKSQVEGWEDNIIYGDK